MKIGSTSSSDQAAVPCATTSVNAEGQRASFTPGPWELSDGVVWTTSPWNARVRLAITNSFSPMNGIDNFANARLMAAAPELLAALKGLATSAHNGDWCFDGCNTAGLQKHSPACDAARAALAKATGSAQ
jgi:hypothetical protein